MVDIVKQTTTKLLRPIDRMLLSSIPHSELTALARLALDAVLELVLG